MSLHSIASSSLAIACLATTLAGLCPLAEAKRTFPSNARKIAVLPKGFVPPPPPYEPSTLPEVQAQKAIRIRREVSRVSNQAKFDVAKPENTNPYSRFIYNRDGYESPQPVQPNKYVTYWSKS
jgi:hypothetical protein